MNPLEGYSGLPLLYGFHADMSPDGRRVVYSTCEFPERDVRYAVDREDYHYDIAVINLDGTEQQRLTENTYLDHYPVWSPDGSRIAFIANPPRKDYFYEEGARLYTMATNGVGHTGHGIHA